MSDEQRNYPPPGAPVPPEQSYPPPGAAQPPPPTWPQMPPPGTQASQHYEPPRPGLALGAAHKPGAFPLRPLNLGAIYDAAFRIIRFNPKATVGAAVLVTSLAMILPVLVVVVLSFTADLAIDASGEVSSEATTSETLGLLAAYGSLGLGYLLAQIGVTLVTGMVTHVAHAAGVGRKLSFEEAWSATHGYRWRLLGLGLLAIVAIMLITLVYIVAWVIVIEVFDVVIVVIWGMLSLPAFVALCAWFWVRGYYLAAPAMLLERRGIFSAMGRSWSLTSKRFWPTFGVALLTFIIGSIGGSMLSAPVQIVASIGAVASPEHGVLIIFASYAIATVVQFAFFAPFSAAVASLQYIDLRIRKEAYDVDLMREAGLIPS